ncbi:MAG: nuclease [Pedosphaera sp.]|nr:nuclease [Pedosphaera sp.]
MRMEDDAGQICLNHTASKKRISICTLIQLFTVLWFCSCFPIRVMAWNAEGHMVVAQIAYNHLDPAVKAKCDALISVTLTNGSSANNTFVTASCWADDYKTEMKTAIWHYIDLPFSLDATPTNGVAPASFDVVRAIRQCIATLQSTNATQIDQATSLRYLIHFVGDIQQPLHASTAVSATSTSGDAGGNSFSLSGGNWNNLHSLWDAGGGYLTDSVSRPLTGTGQTILNTKVAEVEAAHPFSANVGVIPDPMDWANEGWGLAQSVAYVGVTRNSTPSTNYLNTVQATTEARMALGGSRLANLLNTVYSANPFNLTLLPRSNGNVRFSWNAIPGRTYRVQWKQQLDAATWNDLANVIAATNSVSFTNAVGPSLRFYRVKAVVN